MGVFDQIFPGQWRSSGADAQEIGRFMADLRRPLSATEVDEIRMQRRSDVAAPDPSTWRLPQRPLPETYLQFLAWSNDGRCFVNGQRELGFFTTRNLRQMMLEYEFPCFMPEALPFAMNGGGWFYLFDMRQEPSSGEYPVLFAESGVLSFEKAHVLGASLIGVLRDGTDPEAAALSPEDPPYPLRGRVWLVAVPPGGLKGMFRLRRLPAASWGAAQMRDMLRSSPLLIAESGHPYAPWRRLQQEGDLLPCLGYSEGASDVVCRY